METTLSPEQAKAVELIDEFLDSRRPAKQWFTLNGEAGTGKTTILAHVARARRNAVLCSYTGKAASNLTRKTGLPATTIHSAIYRFVGKCVDERGEAELIFRQNVRDGRWDGRIILLDEHSTVDTFAAKDLLATGARIVAVGDDAQLRPVKGTRFFNAPDFTLTEIHRQAWDSPIIRQAHAVRNGGMYQPDTDLFRVQRHVEAHDIIAADVILCWRNATRRNLNLLKRAHLGIEGWPQPGEPVMCLKNDHETGVLNGATYPLIKLEYDRREELCITIENERGETVTLHGIWFEDLDERSRKLDDSIGWTHSYCATVHKFQGSEDDFVILVDEYDRSDDRIPWLNTGITRAKQKILIQRSW